jgi:hemolysin-activating ACP:hemolysin acyltransferase
LIDDVIQFFQTFDRFKDNSKELLHFYLEPSISLNQYKIFGDKEITGFLNWAYLNDITKDKFINHGIIDYGNWKCGDNLCFIHLVCRKDLRDMIKWAKEHFGTNMKYDKEVVWIRINKDIEKVMRINNKWVA